MIIEFHSGHYLKQWNWPGVVPQIGDTILLHFGDKGEEELRYRVVGRTIDGKNPDKIIVDLEWIDR